MRDHYAALLKHDSNGVVAVQAVGLALQGEIAELTDLGFQKIFLTASGKQVPAVAEHLHGLHDFTEDLREALGLTSLYNQSHFFDLLAAETRKSERYNFIYSLVIFDVDNFKNYNDHNGHLRGSETLKRVGALMRQSFRNSDILAKYGGDEFVILLPQTDKIGSFLAAERLRETIEREKFPGGEWQPKGKVTISIGIASYPEHGDTGERIIEKADQALYCSKEAGRNRTTIYSPESAEEALGG